MFGNLWCERESVKCNVLKEWKVSIFNIVDKRIKFQLNLRLLIDIRGRVSKNFIGSMFCFQLTMPQTMSLLFVGYTILTL